MARLLTQDKAEGVVETPPDVARWLAGAAIEPWLRAGRPLGELRVLDPCCGSGALLLAAADVLLEAAVATGAAAADARRRVLGQLVGVELDGGRAEAARAALAGWGGGAGVEPRIINENALLLDWAAGRGVTPRGGFPAVVVNPPYVRARAAGVVEGGPWRSLERGHRDLYLPFLELCLRVVHPEGRVAAIAPSSWVVNEHGRGLRELVAETRRLERWVDLGDRRVFAGVSAYCALQIYGGSPRDEVRVERPSVGLPEAAPAGRVGDAVPYDALGGGPWLLRPKADRELLLRLEADCRRLDEVADVCVGPQTGADRIYQLDRLGPGRYRTASGDEVALDDAMMRPLVRGADATPWAQPSPKRWLLVPYRIEPGGARLLTEEELREEAPATWSWLETHEKELRQRDKGRMNREGWWAYTYPKNLKRQDQPKLLVARLQRRLGCAVDETGALWTDNVDVAAVIPRDERDLWPLAALLNGEQLDRIWRMRAKPFQNGYLSANKQFLAWLPVVGLGESDARQDDGAEDGPLSRSV